LEPPTFDSGCPFWLFFSSFQLLLSLSLLPFVIALFSYASTLLDQSFSFNMSTVQVMLPVQFVDCTGRVSSSTSAQRMIRTRAVIASAMHLVQQAGAVQQLTAVQVDKPVRAVLSMRRAPQAIRPLSTTTTDNIIGHGKSTVKQSTIDSTILIGAPAVAVTVNEKRKHAENTELESNENNNNNESKPSKRCVIKSIKSTTSAQMKLTRRVVAVRAMSMSANGGRRSATPTTLPSHRDTDLDVHDNKENYDHSLKTFTVSHRPVKVVKSKSAKVKSTHLLPMGPLADITHAYSNNC
jgi:hypothetical protein